MSRFVFRSSGYLTAHFLAADVSDFAGGENSSFAIKPFHALPLFSTPFSLPLWAAKKWIDEMTALLSFSHSLPVGTRPNAAKKCIRGPSCPKETEAAYSLSWVKTPFSPPSSPSSSLFCSFLWTPFCTGESLTRPRGQSLWQPLRFILPPSRDSRLTSRTGASITSWSSVAVKNGEDRKDQKRGVGLGAQEEEEREGDEERNLG